MDDLDVVWGAQAIGEVIGVPPRKAFHLLSTGAIPGRKIGSQWVSERNKLKAFFLAAMNMPEDDKAA
jgi:hypothetical protein